MYWLSLDKVHVIIACCEDVYVRYLSPPQRPLCVVPRAFYFTIIAILASAEVRGSLLNSKN